VATAHSPRFPDAVVHSHGAVVWVYYLPAIVVVLMRENEGLLPNSLERIVSRWPAWLRGWLTKPADGGLR